MITRDIPIRVRYYETDCMGIVHHSNYVRYYETARTEMLREFGTTYQEMEREGVMLPVLDVQSHYITPAYDDADRTGYAGRTAAGQNALRLRDFPRKRRTDQHRLGHTGVYEQHHAPGMPRTEILPRIVETLLSGTLTGITIPIDFRNN